MSWQFQRQRLDLIKLVDEEIQVTSHKLSVLRDELARATTKTTAPVQRNALQNRVTQTSLPHPKTSRQADSGKGNFRQKVNQNNVSATKSPISGDRSFDSAFSSCSSSDPLEVQVEPIQGRMTIPKLIMDASPALSSSANSESEERYLAKLRKIFQNRNDKKLVSSNSPNSNGDSLCIDQFANLVVDNIMDKIGDKLIGAKSNEVKELRSVAIETTLRDKELSSSFDDNNYQDDISVAQLTIQDIQDTSTDTVYMHLPVKRQKEPKTRQKLGNPFTTIIPGELERLQSSIFSTTQYLEPPKLNPTKHLVEMDLIKSIYNTSTATHCSSNGPPFNDVSCNTSMFKTLPELSSNCSTPKGRLPPIERIRSTIANSLSYETANQSLPSMNITEFTLNTSSELSVIDNDKFWKDVFRSAEVDDIDDDISAVL